MDRRPGNAGMEMAGRPGRLGCSGVCYNLITKGGRMRTSSGNPAGGRSLLHTECESGHTSGNSLGARVLQGGGKEGRESARALWFERETARLCLRQPLKATASPGVAGRRQGRSFVPCDRTRGLYWLHFSKRRYRPQRRQHLPSVPCCRLSAGPMPQMTPVGNT